MGPCTSDCGRVSHKLINKKDKINKIKPAYSAHVIFACLGDSDQKKAMANGRVHYEKLSSSLRLSSIDKY